MLGPARCQIPRRRSSRSAPLQSQRHAGLPPARVGGARRPRLSRCTLVGRTRGRSAQAPRAAGGCWLGRRCCMAAAPEAASVDACRVRLPRRLSLPPSLTPRSLPHYGSLPQVMPAGPFYERCALTLLRQFHAQHASELEGGRLRGDGSTPAECFCVPCQMAQPAAPTLPPSCFSQQACPPPCTASGVARQASSSVPAAASRARR